MLLVPHDCCCAGCRSEGVSRRSSFGTFIEAFRRISATAKAFQFQFARARALTRKRVLPLAPLDQMAELWHRGLDPVVERYA
jgi:hypothetical protein